MMTVNIIIIRMTAISLNILHSISSPTNNTGSGPIFSDILVGCINDVIAC